MAPYSIKNTLVALTALAAPALGQDNGTTGGVPGVGYAIVKNACSYDVYVNNVPAADGGYNMIPYTLSANGGNAPYQFQYTELTNQQGWSIKLSQSNTDWSNIMQFETTFHNDGMIWYDLSDVNGNPWDGNWMITASGDSSCNPKQQAYRYSTDDAYGMQACNQDASVTVTLCSANGDAAVAQAQSASSSAVSDSNTSETDAASSPAPVPSSSQAISAPIAAQTTLQTTASPVTSSTPAGNYVATTTQIAGTTVMVTTTAVGGAPSGIPLEEEPNGAVGWQASKREEDVAREHIKRHQNAHHRHHGHF